MLSQKLEKPNYQQTQSNLDLLPNVMIFKTTISEKQVILDILYILLGMAGRFLKKNNNNLWQLPKKFKMTHLGSESLSSSITEALKVCNDTQYVQNQSKKLYGRSPNAIVKTFCEAVLDHLQETRKYYEQIFSSFNNLSQDNLDKLTLLSLSKVFGQRIHMLSFLIRCLNICSVQLGNKTQVVCLLDKIWEVEQDLLPFAEVNETFLITIFKRTLRIFFNNIKQWLKVREIPQSMDFFIHLPVGKKGQLPDMLLYQNTQIEPLKLPKIIQNEAKTILEVGKTIRFIKLYYKNYEKEKLMNYLNIDSQFKSLEDLLEFEPFSTFKRVKVEKISLNDRLRNRKKERVPQAKPIPEQNPFEIFGNGEQKYFNLKWISKRQKVFANPLERVQNEGKVRFGFLFHLRCHLFQILETINKKCLHFFRDPYDTLMANQKNRIQTSLSHTLIGIKKFMLGEQGDFVQQFFNVAEDILQKQRGNVSHSKIYSCIDEAIENSNAKNLPKQILNNLHFDFIKNLDDRRASITRVWVYFCFHYQQDSPINYIFTLEILQKLKDSCNLIFRLKIGQTILTHLWSLDKQIHETDWTRQRIVKKSKIIRNSLTVYINNCLSYLLNKIEEIWREYLEKVQQSSTIFGIASQTQQVANKIRSISNEDKLFYNGVMYGVKLVDDLGRLKKNLIDPSSIVQVQDIENLEFEFNSAVELVLKIPELNEMINYNEFFNQLH